MKTKGKKVSKNLIWKEQTRLGKNWDKSVGLKKSRFDQHRMSKPHPASYRNLTPLAVETILDKVKK